jgi:hypothetical protein
MDVTELERNLGCKPTHGLTERFQTKPSWSKDTKAEDRRRKAATEATGAEIEGSVWIPNAAWRVIKWKRDVSR